VLKKFTEVKSHFESHCQEYCTQVTACLRTRLSWSDLQLFRDIIFMLATQGWQKILDDPVDVCDGAEEMSENPLDAIDQLVECFRFSLEGAAVEVSEIRGEFEAMVQYATQFISLSTMEYQVGMVAAVPCTEFFGVAKHSLPSNPSFLLAGVEWQA